MNFIREMPGRFRCKSRDHGLPESSGYPCERRFTDESDSVNSQWKYFSHLLEHRIIRGGFENQGKSVPIGLWTAEGILEKLTTHFESNQRNPWEISFPLEKSKLLQMIVGLEINIQKIEGKFKLSQNRTPQEQQNIINQLGQSSHYEDIELSRCMASYFANNC